MRIKHAVHYYKAAYLYWVLASVIGKTEAVIKIAVKCKMTAQLIWIWIWISWNPSAHLAKQKSELLASVAVSAYNHNIFINVVTDGKPPKSFGLL